MRPEVIIKCESERGQKIVGPKSIVTNGKEEVGDQYNTWDVYHTIGDQYNTWDASRNARFASIA